MREKFKLYGSIFILVIFVPFLLMLWVDGGFGGRQADPVQQQIEEELPFVVAKEVSVGSRTEDLMTLWGASAYEKNMEKFRQAVKETRGEILTVEHQPIQAAYHYAANCKTRNASEVPGQEAAVYLQSVDSPDDMLADGFLSISYMEKQQMADALASLFQEDAPQAENLPGALELTVRDSAGYVTEVTCGRTVANGEAVRQALHLNSACFYFSELDGKIRILTKGIGHGLGLSQYGANELAKQGKNYQDILKYYYQDVTLEYW